MQTRADLPRTIAAAQEVGRVHGYAVAVHGSTVRDLDLLAVPWGAHPDTPEQLCRALVDALACVVSHGPVEKLHGRVSWALLGGRTVHWDGLRARPGYVDLSVIRPR